MQLLPARQCPQLPARGPACNRYLRHWLPAITSGGKLPNCQAHGQAQLGAKCRVAAQATEVLTDQLVTGDRPEAAPAPASGHGTYNWTGRWWPVHVIESLNPTIPQHIDLLGKSLVIWGDSQGNWHCLEDKCPHRLAPLSEGRVEKDNIMCCYHGWTFSGSGSCTSIPQLASDPKAHDNACSSKRSCVTSYPTHIENGLLWVWPEAGPEAAATAAVTKPQHVQQEGCMPWYVRDLPLRYDFLVENVFDPSHIPHAHHGVQGNRYRKQQGWGATNTTVGAVDEGGLVGCSITSFGKSEVVFQAPFYVVYKFNGQLLGAQMAVVPTKPGWSRIFLNFPRPGVIADTMRLPLPAKWLLQLSLNNIPYDHAVTRNAVFDGDTYMLHVAERLLPASKGAGAAVTRAYYLPSPVDGLVTGLRRWFQEYGGQVPTCSPADEAAMTTLSKEEVLDRWSQHTKHCSHCLKAFATVEKAQAVNVVVGLAAAVALVAQAVAAGALTHMPGWAATAAASMSTPSWAGPVGTAVASWWQACQSAGLQQSMLGCSILAIVCLGLYRILTAFRQKFVYEDYIHAFKD